MVNTSDILPNTPRYLKVPLIFFNAILWILGLLLIILGAVVLNSLKNVSGLDINVGLSSGLIVLGVFIIILTVVGSVVAFKEQLVGLIVYTVIMLILLICLIGVGGAAFSYRDDTGSVLKSAWTNAEQANGVLPRLQEYFDCCGWEGVEATFADANITSNKIPCITYTYNYTTPTSAPTSAPTSEPTSEPTSAPTTTPAPNATDPTATPTPTPTPTVTPTPTPTPNATNTTIARSYARITRAENNSTTIVIPHYNKDYDCAPIITSYVRDRLYIAGVAGVVIGVIEFVCMFFSLYLIVRLCRNPRSRSYD